MIVCAKAIHSLSQPGEWQAHEVPALRDQDGAEARSLPQQTMSDHKSTPDGAVLRREDEPSEDDSVNHRASLNSK
jgi:hypothetical protein